MTAVTYDPMGKVTMTLPDVLPSGRTGWALGPRARAVVRRSYRQRRRAGTDRRTAQLATVAMVDYIANGQSIYAGPDDLAV